MMYWFVTAGMTVTLILFAVGYQYRHRDNAKHRRWMVAAIGLNLVSAAFLVIGIYGFHAGDPVAAGFVSSYPEGLVLAHRLLASLTSGLMLAMAITGALRKRALHGFLHWFFIPLYLVVYLSGLVLFLPT